MDVMKVEDSFKTFRFRIYDGCLRICTPVSALTNDNFRRRGVVDDLFGSSLDRKSSDTLAGVSRFSKLLRSFRSGQNSPDQQPTISWYFSSIYLLRLVGYVFVVYTNYLPVFISLDEDALETV